MRVLAENVAFYAGERVTVMGWAYHVREMGQVTFVVLRDRSGSIQVVWENAAERVKEESVIRVEGTVRQDGRAPGGYEIRAEELEVLASPCDRLPFGLNGPAPGLDTMLRHRAYSIRRPDVGAVFTVQAEMVHAFRSFLRQQGFTEISTPKIVSAGTEGGAELFAVRYFDETAYLAQSPQFYKQMMVGAGYERVFEVGKAYRAEPHDTSRHLNEYLSLDLEMGFVKDENDLMDFENALLEYMMNYLAETCKKSLDTLQVKLPSVGEIPRMRLSEVQEILAKQGKSSPEGNLDPEGERLISKYVREQMQSDWLFITHYPASKRPVYTMPDPDNPGLTRSFDLLFRGLEVTTGGQRIHQYDKLVANMRKFGLEPEKFEFYLDIFKYGMPPHGGLAIGAERLTMQICGLSNIREASLFPRDRDRLVP
ncbi:MAG: aspartate--tRNA(Asn) ligase [Bacillota bacterium]